MRLKSTFTLTNLITLQLAYSQSEISRSPAEDELEKLLNLQVEEPSPMVPLNEPTCQNRLADCSIMKELCKDGKNDYNAIYWCQASCNRCDMEMEEVTATTKIPPLMTRPGVDANSEFDDSPGSDESHSDIQKQATNPPEKDRDCYDSMDTCENYRSLCMQPNPVKRRYFLLQCRKTCGLCGREYVAKDLMKPTLPPINYNSGSAGQLDGVTLPSTYEDLALLADPEPKLDPNCQDLYPACRSTTKLMCDSSVSVRINCPKKCELCRIPAWLEGDKEDEQGDICQDISQIYCNSIKHLCNDVNYVPSIHVMCPITCDVGCQLGSLSMVQVEASASTNVNVNINPSTITPTPQTLDYQNITVNLKVNQPPKIVSKCQDLPTCQLLSSKIYCEREIARKNCPVLCNSCLVPNNLDQVISSVSVTEATTVEPTVPSTTVRDTTTSIVKIVSTPETTESVNEIANVSTEVVSTELVVDTNKDKKEEPKNPNCHDKSDNCPIEWCTMPGPRKRSHVRANCRATCNFCSTVTGKNLCEDRPSQIGCPIEYCSMPGPRKVAHVNKFCRKTCGICVPEEEENEEQVVTTTESSVKPVVAHFPLCKDKKPIFCQNYANEDRCNSFRLKTTFRRDCALSCGHCTIKTDETTSEKEKENQDNDQISKQQESNTSQPPLPSGIVPTQPPTCKDKLRACKNNKSKCFLPKYTQYMLKNCKESCGHCAAMKINENSLKVCPEDTRPKLCQTITKNKCETGQYAKWMKANCKKTCGIC